MKLKERLSIEAKYRNLKFYTDVAESYLEGFEKCRELVLEELHKREGAINIPGALLTIIAEIGESDG